MITRLKIGFRKRMMNDHEIENRVQDEVSDGHKSSNNRIWYRNWIQNKMTDCHEICAKVGSHKAEQKFGYQVVQQLDSEQGDVWSQQLEQKLAKRWGVQQVDELQHRASWPSCGSQIRQKVQTNHVWNRHGSVQDSGAGKASSNTKVQMSLGRGSRSTVLDSGQVSCVGRGSTFARIQRYRRQTHDY